MTRDEPVVPDVEQVKRVCLASSASPAKFFLRIVPRVEQKALLDAGRVDEHAQDMFIANL